MTRKLSARFTNWQDNVDPRLIIGAHDHCAPRNKFLERPDIDHIIVSGPDDVVEPHAIALE
jgi:hypothetical protein